MPSDPYERAGGPQTPRGASARRFAVYLGGGVLSVAWIVFCGLLWYWALAWVAQSACAAEPPRAALEYRADLTREARAAWGMQAPVAVMAAQIHQESAWRPDAQSPYADGLAQFVPATAEWVAERWPALGGAAPFNPQWSIRAMARYDRWLFDRYGAPAATACDQWAFTLSAYNGGQGWLMRDRAHCREQPVCPGCDSTRWWGHVADHPDPRRASWAVTENRDYPRRILLQRQPLYRDWGVMVLCEGAP